MADLLFESYRRGGPGWRSDWDPGPINARMIEAARIGIDKVTEIAATMARTTHPLWQSRTYEVEESVFRLRAHYNVEKQMIWGRWGVRGREPHTGSSGSTVENVAMFLEFGTVKMMERPWIYPVWDSTKYLIAPAIKAAYAALPPNFAYRMAGTGTFMSIKQVFASAPEG